MAKIRRLFETSLLLNFEHPEDALDRYWAGFLQTDLGKIYQAIPWGELIKVFGLKDHPRGRRATFSPQGKLAVMFLKHYANCSDQQLVEQLSGNLYYQLFCGVRIAPDQPLRDGKLVSEIRCSLAKNLQIDQAQAVLAQHWLPYMKQTDIVLMDATCYESSVRYPTDQKLLWEAVEWSYQQLCSHCKCLGIRRPRTKYLKWKARYESYRRLRRRPAGRRRSITGGLLRLFAKIDAALAELEKEELNLPQAYFGKRELMQRAYSQQFGKFYEGADIKGRIVSFGNEKNRYGLQRIKARGQPTEILWIFFGIHTPNALQIGRRIEQHNALKQAA